MFALDDHLQDLFAPLSGVSFRRMFGGVGIFRDGLMFALVADGTLHMKVDDITRADFEAEGCSPWVYEGKNGAVTMPYWPAPERLFDEPDEFAAWAQRAFEVAVRANAGKVKRKRVGKKR